MKNQLLTVRELAARLRMSVKSIQRAYRKGHIPVKWICRTAFFDLQKVYDAMEENGKARVASLINGGHSGATAGASRRAQAVSPRSVKRGRNFQQAPRRNA